MSRYETDIDLDNPNTSQTQLIELVGAGKSVLDVGCAGGETARALVERGCRVSGVDIDPVAAEPARAVLDELVIADLDRTPLSAHFEAKTFDVIIFGDVLEHLRDPALVLKDALSLLAAGGHVLVSVPNVAHAAIRLALLQGQWAYTRTGLLDSTHVRFFTRDAVCDLLEDAGLVIEQLRALVLDPIETEVEIDGARLPPTIVEWVRHQPDSMHYQYVASARLVEPGETAAGRPPVQPVIPLDAARRTDEHTERADRDREERHRMLNIRDHIIGLEASLVSAQGRGARAATRARSAERRARQLEARITQLTSDLTALSQPAPRSGPMRRLARALRSRGGER